MQCELGLEGLQTAHALGKTLCIWLATDAGMKKMAWPGVCEVLPGVYTFHL